MKTDKVFKYKRYVLKVVSVALVLALLLAYLPQPGSTWIAKAAKAEMQMEIVGKRIVVSVTGFPKKNVYFVKAGGIGATGDDWIKVGRLRTGKNTELSTSYRLPKPLRYMNFIKVCLKNATSDAVICATAPNPNAR